MGTQLPSTEARTQAPASLRNLLVRDFLPPPTFCTQLCCIEKSSFRSGMSAVNAHWPCGSEAKFLGDLPRLGLSLLLKFESPPKWVCFLVPGVLKRALHFVLSLRKLTPFTAEDLAGTRVGNTSCTACLMERERRLACSSCSYLTHTFFKPSYPLLDAVGQSSFNGMAVEATNSPFA